MATSILDRTIRHRDVSSHSAELQDRSWPTLLRRCTLAAVALGVLWRLLRYALQFPVWGDEAFVCLNLPEQTYAGLTGPLKHGQIVPLLFLWAELAMYQLLGGSELAIRLVPMLAGLASVFLFWRVCRLTLPALPAALACAFLAVSYTPVRHGCEVKPYAFDLFMPLLLMVPALQWLRRPEQTRWLILLTCLTPIALFGSYPAVFVAGSLSLIMLPQAWRPHRAQRVWFVVYNLVMVACFFGHYAWIGRAQLGPPEQGVESFLQNYWEDAFPPRQPLDFGRWLLQAHTGQMFGYPIGSSNGGSTLTLLLCLIGAGSLWRGGRSRVVVLCVGALGLALLAALLRAYPYGSSARLAQHLAPAICLLAGAGLAHLIMRLSPVKRSWATALVFGLLAAVACAGLIRDLRQPFKTKGEIAARNFVDGVVRSAAADETILVLEPPAAIKSTLLWYLKRHEQRIHFVDQTNAQDLSRAAGLWCMHFGWQPVDRDQLQERLPTTSWRLVRHDVERVPGDRPSDPVEIWEAFRWKTLD